MEESRKDPMDILFNRDPKDNTAITIENTATGEKRVCKSKKHAATIIGMAFGAFVTPEMIDEMLAGEFELPAGLEIYETVKGKVDVSQIFKRKRSDTL